MQIKWTSQVEDRGFSQDNLQEPFQMQKSMTHARHGASQTRRSQSKQLFTLDILSPSWARAQDCFSRGALQS